MHIHGCCNLDFYFRSFPRNLYQPELSRSSSDRQGEHYITFMMVVCRGWGLFVKWQVARQLELALRLTNTNTNTHTHTNTHKHTHTHIYSPWTPTRYLMDSPQLRNVERKCAKCFKLYSLDFIVQVKINNLSGINLWRAFCVSLSLVENWCGSVCAVNWCREWLLAVSDRWLWGTHSLTCNGSSVGDMWLQSSDA